MILCINNDTYSDRYSTHHTFVHIIFNFWAMFFPALHLVYFMIRIIERITQLEFKN